MNFNRFTIISVIIPVVLCSCTDISGRVLPGVSENSDYSENSEFTESSGNSESSGAATERQTNGEEYKTYVFSQSDEDFLKSACFVGDGLVLGLREFGFTDNIIADAGLTPSGINSVVMKNGLDVKTTLINTDSEDVVFFMKADSESADGFAAFIKEVRAFLPEAMLYIMLAPPVTPGSAAYNEALTSAVSAMRDNRVLCVDVNAELKNGFGKIKTLYADEYGGLTEKAYYAALWSLVKAANG